MRANGLTNQCCKRVLIHLLRLVMGVFMQPAFESFLCGDAADYYRTKAKNWIKVDSCHEYMLKVEGCLETERDIVFHYLDEHTGEILVKTMLGELLETLADQLLHKENYVCRALLRDNKVEDLSRMYILYNKLPTGLKLVGNVFRQLVTAEGTTLVEQAEKAANNQVLIRDLMQLHDQYMRYVEDFFMNHTLIQKPLKEAFVELCSKTVGGCSSAELFATFCDNILKKGRNEKLSDEEIEKTVERVVKLIAYISDKDLFVEFYRTKLGRRLIFDQSADEDHEKIILTKLKQEFGGLFTLKMEGMVKDLVLARELQTGFPTEALI